MAVEVDIVDPGLEARVSADRFEGSRIIVTGAGSGIGAATARRLAGEGAALVLNDIEPDYLDPLLQELPGTGHVVVAGDISQEETAEELVRRGLEGAGRIDGLVSNVGLMFARDITDTSVEDWDRVMGVNLRGQFLACRAVVPPMLRQGRGSIVCLGSISSFVGQEMGDGSSFVYNVTKAGVRQLATSLATRYAGDGIRVNSVCPGPVRTRQVRHFHPGLTEEQEDEIWRAAGDEGVPMGRVGTAEEVAAVISFLLSEEASFVTGAAYMVDGGYLAR